MPLNPTRLALALALATSLAGCIPAAQSRGDGTVSETAPSAEAGLVPDTSPAPYLASRPPEWDPPTISTKELRDRMARHADLLVLDVRAKETFDFEHITGAQSFPWAAVSKEHDSLPKTRTIVLYCA